MFKQLLDFLNTGLYLIFLYVFYFVIAFILTLFLGLPIGLAVYYIIQAMAHYII